LSYDELKLNVPNNLEIINLDINPISSVSKARNEGCNYIKSKLKFLIPCNESYLTFLDAGDTLSSSMITKTLSNKDDYDLILGLANIQSSKATYIRPRIPLRLKYIINPIFLGSALIKVELAVKHVFHDGRREDWKYWLDLLSTNPSINFIHEIHYDYFIQNKYSHFKRKISLFPNMVSFYRNFLKFNFFKSSLYLIAHYSVHLILWLVLIRKKKQK
jgi:hypothetical protein